MNNNDTLKRVETSVVSFIYKSGEVDWPGVFIRGDEAFQYAHVLDQIKNSLDDKKSSNKLNMFVLEGLIKLLKQSNISDPSHNRENVIGVMCKNI